MPAGAGECRLWQDRYSPKTRSLVKLKVVTFGNGDAWPVIKGRPFRRVSDPEGKSCSQNSSGGPWRPRRVMD